MMAIEKFQDLLFNPFSFIAFRLLHVIQCLLTMLYGLTPLFFSLSKFSEFTNEIFTQQKHKRVCAKPIKILNGK